MRIFELSILLLVGHCWAIAHITDVAKHPLLLFCRKTVDCHQSTIAIGIAVIQKLITPDACKATVEDWQPVNGTVIIGIEKSLILSLKKALSIADDFHQNFQGGTKRLFDKK